MMQAGAIARFGGITAYGDKFHGEGFHFVDLDGWTDTPQVDVDRVRRPAQHGIFLLPTFARERVVRLSGFHVAPTHMQMEHASARVRGLLTSVVRLSIEDTHATHWVDGTVTEAIYRNHGFAAEGRWSLEVECADPRKYGPVNDFTAGTVAVQRGNFPATPRLMIGAGSGGYTVTGPNGRQVVVGTAPAAAHYIDFANGGLYTSAGVRQVGAITIYQPWSIPPGIPGVTATISGSRSLIQRVTDTFI